MPTKRTKKSSAKKKTFSKARLNAEIKKLTHNGKTKLTKQKKSQAMKAAWK